MSEKGGKLKASPQSKNGAPDTQLSPPPSSRTDRKALQGRSSSRSSSSTHTLGTLLLVLAFAACFLQMFLFRQPDLLNEQQRLQFFDNSAWTLDNSTLNRNIMGVELVTKQRIQSIDAISESKSTIQDVVRKDIKDMNLTADAFPKADIANDEHPIIQLLRNAGINDLTEKDKKHLPDWKALQRLYGNLDEPLIVGLETCASYRNMVPPPKRYAAVAGLFNTGTNAMEHHLRKNIVLNSAWQVPWGKHRMEFVRLNHTASGLEKYNQLEALPIVLIRDPYSWMHSMCKSSYAAHWKSRPAHCPNLVPDEDDRKRFGNEINDTFPVKVIFDEHQKFHWDSLAHLWSDWYNYYLKATYPRLIFRFEDMILHAPTIMKIIADCAGTTVPDAFTFQSGSSKSHGSGTTFLKVVEKTGDAALRVARMSTEDLIYAKEHLDENLMRIFQYSYPPMS
ncbi:hypothetical protein MPSEU_000267500 [Mayamaea pseudoterrestris]|nr:hypothetical protein MPSEU_000267500 [Mayamaea pseudoterrestris]